MRLCLSPWGPEEGTGAPDTGIAGRCELLEEDQAQVPCKSSKCSSPLSHLSSPSSFSLIILVASLPVVLGGERGLCRCKWTHPHGGLCGRHVRAQFCSSRLGCAGRTLLWLVTQGLVKSPFSWPHGFFKAKPDFEHRPHHHRPHWHSWMVRSGFGWSLGSLASSGCSVTILGDRSQQLPGFPLPYPSPSCDRWLQAHAGWAPLYTAWGFAVDSDIQF